MFCGGGGGGGVLRREGKAVEEELGPPRKGGSAEPLLPMMFGALPMGASIDFDKSGCIIYDVLKLSL